MTQPSKNVTRERKNVIPYNLYEYSIVHDCLMQRFLGKRVIFKGIEIIKY